MQKPFKLILASQSPRRRELLGHTGLPFTAVSLDLDEHSDSTNPEQFALDIGKQKTAGAQDYANKNNLENPFFVVSDTLVALDGKILGKPKGDEEAKEMLNFLAGKQHRVFTSVGFTWQEGDSWKEHFFVDEAKVTFSQIDAEMMDHYISTGESLDKAGAYGIQGPALVFIDSLQGSYSTVMGFPLSKFMQELATVAKDFVSSDVSWRSVFN
jgi:septum formation protein